MLTFKLNLKLTGLMMSLLLLTRVAAAGSDRPLEYDSLDLTDGRKLVQSVIKNYAPASDH